MNYHDNLIGLFDTYMKETDKFNDGNDSAGTRARKALAEISKLCKERRAEIQNIKNQKKSTK